MGHRVWVAFDREICLALRTDLHYVMAAWVREFSLSLEEIPLPTLSIWEDYLPTLGLWKAEHDTLDY